MMTRSPCDKACPDRTVTCHGFCKRYKEWQEIHEKELAEKRAVVEAGAYEQRRRIRRRRGQI